MGAGATEGAGAGEVVSAGVDVGAGAGTDSGVGKGRDEAVRNADVASRTVGGSFDSAARYACAAASAACVIGFDDAARAIEGSNAALVLAARPSSLSLTAGMANRRAPCRVERCRRKAGLGGALKTSSEAGGRNANVWGAGAEETIEAAATAFSAARRRSITGLLKSVTPAFMLALSSSSPSPSCVDETRPRGRTIANAFFLPASLPKTTCDWPAAELLARVRPARHSRTVCGAVTSSTSIVSATTQ